MNKIPGARWWTFDFHAHSPASLDYGKGPSQSTLRTITPEEWLLGFMRANIDCVAITDHNSGGWIDSLKAALIRLKEQPHPEYLPLYLFPGVELTANGGVHVLAIFDLSASSEDISRLIGAVEYNGECGASDLAANSPVIQIIDKIDRAGGIAILAHVDDYNGTFTVLSGNTLEPILLSEQLYAMELCNPSFAKPATYTDKGLSWVEVLGSDSHHPTGSAGQRFPGSHFTWVKMGEPTLEGLRLALLDNAPLSICRSDQSTGNPNQHANLFIEALAVKDAKLCGRGDALVAQFNPWMNAIIGGRGSGKSSLIEFMRIAFRRHDELSGFLRKNFDDFAAIPEHRDEHGALTAKTQLRILINKDGVRYRVQWSPDGTLDQIMEIDSDGNWIAAPGEARLRFPVRIFSQKQIYAMSEEGEALIRVLDEAPEVNVHGWETTWQQESSRFLSLRAKIRELQTKIAEEGTFRGELDDVLRKLAIFEGEAHAGILVEYQQRKRQEQAVSTFTESLDSLLQHLVITTEKFAQPESDRSLFDTSDTDVLLLMDEAGARVRELASQLEDLALQARQNNEQWQTAINNSEWFRKLGVTDAAYQALVTELITQGIDDPSLYGVLVQKRQALEQKLSALAVLHDNIDEVSQEAESCLTLLGAHRKEISRRRSEFLSRTLDGNLHVRINVMPFGRALILAEQKFRSIIDREDGKCSNDILSEDQQNGVIAELYSNLPENLEDATNLIEERLLALKANLLKCALGEDAVGYGGWFVKHLRQLSPEVLDKILCWFPDDMLSVHYSPTGNGRDFRPLEHGSPGQKTAAILAFLLAHGNEPIILDQPEDDLDNHLIYDLIVSQLRENKRRRQVIVVTHNPNIVVNGDAEMVFAMDQRGGQCRIIDKGCLQSLSVREEVCRVMEGGREAFKKRYRRIVGGIR
ncbi:MAG: AAA family ATPase [Desulfuromonadaceae bacterium]|nr:AAA family ATPase [Desulfuromonadaceae bacterium]